MTPETTDPTLESVEHRLREIVRMLRPGIDALHAAGYLAELVVEEQDSRVTLTVVVCSLP